MSENVRFTCYDSGINWCWYCDVELLGNNEVIIHKHYRIHYGDDGHPSTSRRYRMVEDGERIVQAIIIDGTRYEVRNKKHILDYK